MVGGQLAGTTGFNGCGSTGSTGTGVGGAAVGGTGRGGCWGRGVVAAPPGNEGFVQHTPKACGQIAPVE